jgi:hypothetical protein
MKPEVCEQYGLRPFYKSYSHWEKMTADQRNKSLAWFRKLPDHLKGNYYIFMLFHSLLDSISSFTYHCINFILTLFSYYFTNS